MTAEELTLHLCRDCEQSRDVVTDILRALADQVQAELAAGRSVPLPGLGTLATLDALGPAHDVRIQFSPRAELRRDITAARRGPAAPTLSPATEAWMADRHAETATARAARLPAVGGQARLPAVGGQARPGRRR